MEYFYTEEYQKGLKNIQSLVNTIQNYGDLELDDAYEYTYGYSESYYLYAYSTRENFNCSRNVSSFEKG